MEIRQWQMKSTGELELDTMERWKIKILEETADDDGIDEGCLN